MFKPELILGIIKQIALSDDKHKARFEDHIEYLYRKFEEIIRLINLTDYEKNIDWNSEEVVNALKDCDASDIGTDFISPQLIIDEGLQLIKLIDQKYTFDDPQGHDALIVYHLDRFREFVYDKNDQLKKK